MEYVGSQLATSVCGCIALVKYFKQDVHFLWIVFSALQSE